MLGMRYGVWEVCGYIFVVDDAHQVKLPVRPLGVGVIVESVLQLLHRHPLVAHSVHRRSENKQRK